jgi:hypothetical protein
MSIFSLIKEQYEILSDEISTKKQPEKETIEKSIVIDSNFRLPMTYLDEKEVYDIPDNITNDLELLNNDNNSVYHKLLQPQTCFSKQILPKWNKQYTTNTEFLKDSQTLIKNLEIYKKLSSTPRVNIESILPIWKNTKQNTFFYEKYNYLDWNILKQFNLSSLFLQITSVIHIISPILTLVLPILMLIFPFIILKVQGVPVSVDLYITTLKNIAKNHSFGKILLSIGTLSWDRIVYMFFTIGLYIFQIYQNINQCKRFYKNIVSVNNDLLFMKNYLDDSIEKMHCFTEVIKDLPSYSEFTDVSLQHMNTLEIMKTELDMISPFKHTFNKFYEMGYMLKMYYILHINKEYEESLKYSLGMNGYIENMCILHDTVIAGDIHFSTFTDENICKFNKQYYPIMSNNLLIKNDIDMKKNIIISAPNKAGKTTLIKTTLINIIMTQQFGCGFYDSATLNPYHHIHCYLNIPDTSARDSLFQAESRRCKEIIDSINADQNKNNRHFCIFDELYSGTNPEEAIKAGSAFLKYLTSYKNVQFILTTHYKEICKQFKKSEHISNYKMLVNINKDETFDYTYKFTKGISEIKGGLRVLKDMDYPQEIINLIAK